MLSLTFSFIVLGVGVLCLGAGVFLYWRSAVFKGTLKKQQEEMRRKMYEATILKELGERIGYSLDVHNIVDIITGSLHDFLEYSTVSYILLEPEKIIFRSHLELPVSGAFLDDVRDRMLESFSALLDKTITKKDLEEVVSGAARNEESEEPVRSFFNIPLVIGGEAVGVLTVAHTKAGLYKEEEMAILYKIVKQASAALTRLQDVVATEERKLNAMVESMVEGVIMTDKDYRIMVINPAAKKIIGLEEKEDITIFDIISKLGNSFAIRGRLEESLKFDKLIVEDEVFIGDRFMKIFVSPVKGIAGSTKGEILGGVVIFHDITHEKEVERIRDDFTSMVVHELRTPLGNFRKATELILREGLDKKVKEYKDYMHMMLQSSLEMLDWVNDLLDIAKIESGKFEVLKRPDDIMRIVKGRVSFFKASAEDAHIDLVVKSATDVPKEMAFDQLRMSQVLNNLISNALKFTDEGVKVIVEVFLHKKGKSISEEAVAAGMEWRDGSKEEPTAKNIPDSLVIAVTDSGIGIAEKDIPLLFNRFHQVRARIIEKSKKGTGLGLVIAKGIAEAHGGVIGVQSEEGRGSTFYVTLPLNF